MSGSDFESEHDTDSETEEPQSRSVTTKNNLSSSLPAESDKLILIEAESENINSADWQQHLVPNEDGSFTYTDSNNGIVYHWVTDKQEWVNKSQLLDSKNVNESSKHSKVYNEETNPKSNSDSADDTKSQLKKSSETEEELNTWQQQLTQNKYGQFTYTDPIDNCVYEWDSVKQSWHANPVAIDSQEESIESHSLSSQTSTLSYNKSEDIDIIEELKDEAQNEKTNPKLEPWQEYLVANEQKKSDGITYTDPTDGTMYEWNAEKKAWFPKIDDDFIAAYQANYGFIESEEPVENATKDEKSEKKETPMETNTTDAENKGKKRKPEEPAWFDIEPEKNTNVYVSGLPLDITDEEYLDLMTKCGILMEDNLTQKSKIKLYRDEYGNPKGDGRCCYLRAESVTLALQLLDESRLRGSKIKVERAIFQLKGKYNPALKPKKKQTKKKKKKTQAQMLDWVDRDNKRNKFDRIVILKHMFDPTEFENNPLAIIEIKEDIRTECLRFGEVKKVLVFDRHPDGICSVLFVEPEMADECITALDGRWFSGQQIHAERYDGVTKYDVKETEKEREQRSQEWERFLKEETATKEKDTITLMEETDTEASNKEKDTETLKKDTKISENEKDTEIPNIKKDTIISMKEKDTETLKKDEDTETLKNDTKISENEKDTEMPTIEKDTETEDGEKDTGTPNKEKEFEVI